MFPVPTVQLAMLLCVATACEELNSKVDHLALFVEFQTCLLHQWIKQVFINKKTNMPNRNKMEKSYFLSITQ